MNLNQTDKATQEKWARERDIWQSGMKKDNARQQREKNESERDFNGRVGVLAGCNDVLQEHD